MTNICSNNYQFIFSNREKAQRFLDFILSPDYKGSLYEMGVKANIKDAENRGAREWVEDAYILSPYEVRVATSSKWVPCPNTWEDIAETFDEDVIVYYEAEEPGCEIYASNDPDFIGHFIIDIWDESVLLKGIDFEPGAYIYSSAETVSALQSLLKTDNDDISILLYMLKNSKYSETVHIHEIEYFPISDWRE